MRGRIALSLLGFAWAGSAGASVALQITGVLQEASEIRYVVKSERSAVVLSTKSLNAEQKSQLGKVGSRVTVTVAPEQIESVVRLRAGRGSSNPIRK